MREDDSIYCAACHEEAECPRWCPKCVRRVCALCYSEENDLCLDCLHGRDTRSPSEKRIAELEAEVKRLETALAHVMESGDIAGMEAANPDLRERLIGPECAALRGEGVAGYQRTRPSRHVAAEALSEPPAERTINVAGSPLPDPEPLGEPAPPDVPKGCERWRTDDDVNWRSDRHYTLGPLPARVRYFEFLCPDGRWHNRPYPTGPWMPGVDALGWGMDCDAPDARWLRARSAIVEVER